MQQFLSTSLSGSKAESLGFKGPSTLSVPGRKKRQLYTTIGNYVNELPKKVNRENLNQSLLMPEAYSNSMSLDISMKKSVPASSIQKFASYENNSLYQS